MQCLRCDRPMRRGAIDVPDGTVRLACFGMCEACARHTRRNGMVIDFTTRPRTRTKKPMLDTVEDFEFLTESMGVRCRTNRFGFTNESRRRIAGRLNLTIDALDKALDRARKAAARH